MPFEKKKKKGEPIDLSKVTFSSLEKDYHEATENADTKEALRLVRCIITCNDINKQKLSGEIFTAQNDVLPEIKKFVQFNTPTHIPKILLGVIKEKKLQRFKASKNNISGVSIQKGYLTNMYNVQILPPLSREELESIKKKQLAEGYTPGEE